MPQETVEVRMTFDTDSGELTELDLISAGEMKSKQVEDRKKKATIDFDKLKKAHANTHKLRPHMFLYAHGSPG